MGKGNSVDYRNSVTGSNATMHPQAQVVQILAHVLHSFFLFCLVTTTNPSGYHLSAQGAKFSDALAAANTFEGSLIRALRRLDELLHEVCSIVVDYTVLTADSTVAVPCFTNVVPCHSGSDHACYLL